MEPPRSVDINIVCPFSEDLGVVIEVQYFKRSAPHNGEVQSLQNITRAYRRLSLVALACPLAG